MSGRTTTEIDAFRATVQAQIAAFESTALVRRVAHGSVSITHYHAILSTLFHQTRSGPYTFALAAVNCSWKNEVAKEYLLRHAEAEHSHWRWILDDLRATDYAGPDPRATLPHPTCEAYISFNERVAQAMPMARLAIASVLEGIGGTFGAIYGRKLLQVLGLKASQASFFISHGETDKTHMVELDRVISTGELSPDEWSWMCHAATVGGQFYRAMYDHEAYS